MFLPIAIVKVKRVGREVKTTTCKTFKGKPCCILRKPGQALLIALREVALTSHKTNVADVI